MVTPQPYTTHAHADTTDAELGTTALPELLQPDHRLRPSVRRGEHHVRFLSLLWKQRREIFNKPYFMLVDDDVWINIPLLLLTLRPYSPDLNVMFVGLMRDERRDDAAQLFNDTRGKGMVWAGGGAGLILTRRSMQEIASRVATPECPFAGWCDMSWSRCASRWGVTQVSHQLQRSPSAVPCSALSGALTEYLLYMTAAGFAQTLTRRTAAAAAAAAAVWQQPSCPARRDAPVPPPTSFRGDLRCAAADLLHTAGPDRGARHAQPVRHRLVLAAGCAPDDPQDEGRLQGRQGGGADKDGAEMELHRGAPLPPPAAAGVRRAGSGRPVDVLGQRFLEAAAPPAPPPNVACTHIVWAVG